MSAASLRSRLGTALGAALAAAGWWHWRSAWSLGLLAAAVGLFFLALAAPRRFAPVQRGFDALGRGVAAAFTWVVLALLYLFIFTPGRLFLLLLRRDPLQRRPDSRRTSYWEPLPPPAGPERFHRQY